MLELECKFDPLATCVDHLSRESYYLWFEILELLCMNRSLRLPCFEDGKVDWSEALYIDCFSFLRWKI
ncbi:hypothetical protein HanIR_Chr09g0420081 [Helianthus annuus]|nr:hypothetical protein HanIR_Chr09g0420081 [Helianthus annuus]